MLKQRALTSLGAFAVVVVLTSGPDAARAIELPGVPGVVPAVSVPASPTLPATSLQAKPPKVTVTLPPLPTVTPPKVAPPTVTAPQVATPKATVPTVAAPKVAPAVSVPSAGAGGAAAGGAPAAAGTDSARARARHAAPDPASKRQRRDRRLRQMVRNFGGCLGALPAAERRVLMLRAGTGPGRPLSRRQVAARIVSSSLRVARTERRGLRRLRARARTGGCGAASPSASSGDSRPASTPRRDMAPTVLAAFKSDGGSAGSVGRSNGSRPGVKGASATSPRAATAQSIVGDGGVQRPPLALLMLAAFLIGAGIAWTVLAPVHRSRSQA